MINISLITQCFGKRGKDWVVFNTPEIVAIQLMIYRFLAVE